MSKEEPDLDKSCGSHSVVLYILPPDGFLAVSTALFTNAEGHFMTVFSWESPIRGPKLQNRHSFAWGSFWECPFHRQTPAPGYLIWSLSGPKPSKKPRLGFSLCFTRSSPKNPKPETTRSGDYSAPSSKTDAAWV